MGCLFLFSIFLFSYTHAYHEQARIYYKKIIIYVRMNFKKFMLNAENISYILHYKKTCQITFILFKMNIHTVIVNAEKRVVITTILEERTPSCPIFLDMM